MKNRGVTKTKTIDWNFGDKHKSYLRDCKYNNINVAEGAVRAGKTIDNVFAFSMELEHSPDKIHLASGTTVGNAKLNIGESNGFGLEYIFRGRCRWGKFKGNECLYVNTITGQKVIIFAGAGKANSFKSIRGNSYGLWIATEINLHDDSFIKEAFNRQLMAINRKIFWDLNPDRPTHFIYEKYIDHYGKMQKEGRFVGGYNHRRFRIFDNDNLTAERIEEIKSQYEVNSVWYRRDIEGERAIAEGLIYGKFADIYKDFLTDEIPKAFEKIVIGVDFGGSKSKHAFVCTGITRGYKEVIVLMSEVHEADSPNALNKALIEFIKKVFKQGYMVNYIYADSAEQVLIRGIREALSKAKIKILIRNSRKEKIIDRIRLVNILIVQKRLFYTESSLTVRDALMSAVWDKDAEEDERLDDGTSDIDTLDAFEYSIERDIRRFIKR